MADSQEVVFGKDDTSSTIVSPVKITEDTVFQSIPGDVASKESGPSFEMKIGKSRESSENGKTERKNDFWQQTCVNQRKFEDSEKGDSKDFFQEISNGSTKETSSEILQNADKLVEAKEERTNEQREEPMQDSSHAFSQKDEQIGEVTGEIMGTTTEDDIFQNLKTGGCIAVEESQLETESIKKEYFPKNLKLVQVFQKDVFNELVPVNEKNDESVPTAESSETNNCKDMEKCVSPENALNQQNKSPPYERSAVNNDLIQKVLKHPLASRWEATSHNPYVLTPVAENSWEFDEVDDLFSPTSCGLEITKLYRVENPYLLALYLNKTEKMQTESFLVEEKMMFHGTASAYVDGICANNFDWRRRGRSRGHKFGQGVSFSPNVWYAHHYSRDRVMFLTRVLVSKKTVGCRDTVVPPEPYDTTTNVPECVCKV